MITGNWRGQTTNADIEYLLNWAGKRDSEANHTQLNMYVYYRAGSVREGTLSYRAAVDGAVTSGVKSVTLGSDWVAAGTLKGVTVAHAIDGTASMTVKGSGNIAGEDFSFSRTFTLAAIDRASRLKTASDVEAGGTLRFTYAPTEMEFSHAVAAHIGAYQTSMVLSAPTAALQQCELALPIESAAGALTGTTVTGELRLTTSYKGSIVGNVSKLPFTFTVPDCAQTRPVVSVTATPATTLPTAFAGLFLQGKTGVQASVSAKGAYGAEATPTVVTLEGKDYAAPFLTGAPLDAGELTLKASATDTRGLVGTGSAVITVLPYEKPRILAPDGTAPVVCRAENGVPGSVGEELYVSAMSVCSPVMADGVARNACSLVCRIRPLAGGEDLYGLVPISADGSAFSGTVKGVTLSRSASYAIELISADRVGERVSVTVALPTEEVSFHLREGGMGAAFGKYAEEERVLEIAPDWTLRLHGNLDDSVTVSDTALLSLYGEDAFSRVTLSGGKRVQIHARVPLPQGEAPVTLGSELVPLALCPTRSVFAIGVGEGGTLCPVSLDTQGTLTLHAVHLPGDGTPTPAWVELHIEYER